MSSDQTATSTQPHSGCSILTVSTSFSTARRFVSRVQSLSSSSPSLADEKFPGPDISQSSSIPYTLVNRYYRADVSFVPYETKTVSPAIFSVANSSDLKPPPALIFIWVDGEPYAKHVEELSRLMASREYEPEVCLAVRLAKPDSAPDSEISNNASDAGQEEANLDMDSTLMEFGFEYVDATIEATPRSASQSEATDDVPRLPRVLDALSTIMWPSMESASSSKSQDASQPSARRLAERDALMEELFAVSEISGISSADNRSRMVPDSSADEHSDDDFSAYDFDSGTVGSFSVSTGATPKPWLTASTSGFELKSEATSDIVTSPTDIPGDASQFPIEASTKQVSMGFEDDFTVFVSAPPALSENPSSSSHLDDDGYGTSTSGLAPSSAATLGAGKMAYRSLGSISDFGGDDDLDNWNRYQTLHDEEKQEGGIDAMQEPDVDDLDDGWADEDGVPTKEEILSTAEKIFGAKLLTKSTADDASKVGETSSKGEPGRALSTVGAATASTSHDVDSDDEIFAGSGGDIDITRIFDGLREMRSEIAAVEDEGERRRMAARVALGFVYAMDLDIPSAAAEKK